MYKKQLILFCALLIFLSLLIGYPLFHVTGKDLLAYQELLESSQAEQNLLLNYSEQTRKSVAKEIWYQESSLLYYRIQSAESQLFFFHQEGAIEVVEELENVRCFMQESLYHDKETGKPMQLVRYLEAEKASYNYNTQIFVAKDVKLWRYRLEGHDPVSAFEGLSPLLSGTARTVEFNFKGKKPDFHAQQFRATFDSKEEIL